MTGLKSAAGKASTSSALAIEKSFEHRFGAIPKVFRAPGRVNLIGEHTDYNDGFVMPAALEFVTYAAVTPRKDRTLRVYSDNFDDTREFNLDAIPQGSSNHWSDYVRGVAAVLESKGCRLSGADLLIRGEVPIGSGLSSSAAIEVATAMALLTNSNCDLDRISIAKACQSAENLYTGARCGIMDQFASCFGKAGHALMLDCRTLAYETLPLAPQTSLVICNTNVKHEIASGEYNRRRAECENSVRILQKLMPHISALRDVSLEDLNRYRSHLPEVEFRRSRHVVSENARVHDAAQSLNAGDLERFGSLMYQSHASLRDDYEVSSRELDIMVEIARGFEGVYGARMTGGGFGGCTVNLVKAEAVEAFKTQIQKEYEAATGVEPAIYVCAAAEGAGAVK